MKIFKSLLICIKSFAIVLFLIILTFTNSHAQELAFPSAFGAGAYATGGRTFGVYHVTNLDDNGNGSFRQAIGEASINGGGTIVFDISGIIVLTSTLGFTDNLTIAGQTAPDGGITIDGERVFVGNVDNLIVRYIRFRGGIDGNDDSLTVRNNVTNQIWDHCSFGFGDDEGASWYETQSQYSVDNLTVQRCLFAENSKGSIVGGQTGGATTGDISFNYNLFYNNSHRFPNSSGVNANIEVINNVVWNVGSRLIRTNGSGQNLNHIGNYYHYNNRGINDDRINAFSYETGYPNIYTSGNKIVAPVVTSQLASSVSAMNADNTLSWKHFIDGTITPQGTRNKGDQLEAEYFTDTQHILLGRAVTIITAEDAFDNVRQNVGADKGLNADGSVSENKDAEDTYYLNQIGLGNYNAPLGSGDYSVTPINSIIRPDNFYLSNPHIPEAYLNSRNIVGDETIHNQVQPSGYTLLEEYINQVDSLGNVEATGLNITPNVATLNVSETINLDVQFTPANTTNQSGVWTTENESIAIVDINGTVTGVSEGVVEIRFVSNDGGFEDNSLVTVIAQPLIADAGSDQSICEGDSVILTASGGTDYLWSTGETTQSITVNPVTTETYSVIVSDGNQEDTDNVTVFVDTIPNLNVSEDVTIIEGESTTLAVEGASNYLWSTGETTNSIIVNPTVTTTYSITGSNGSCDVQDQVTVIVEEIFVATAGDDVRLCEGSGEEVTLSASNGDSYLWNTGETTQTITVSPISTTTYSVVVSSGIQEDTDDVTVFVDPNPNVVIVNGDSVDILNGDFITLSATGANSYEWNNGATQPNIAVSPSATTTYEVRGYINDCYDEKQVTVNVFEPVQAYAGEDISICLNEVATLTATGGDQFLWSTGEITQSIQVSPFITTDYTVTVFNALDFDEATVRVTVLGQCNESTESQNDLSDDVSFNIYPNPAYSYVNVRLNGGSGVSDVLIYDFTGKIVQQNRIENQNQLQEINSRIELRTLTNGIYFIKLVDNNGNELTKKLIVLGNTQ